MSAATEEQRAALRNACGSMAMIAVLATLQEVQRQREPGLFA